MKRTARKYTEVKLGETKFEKSYKNPMTRTFQYEYALYEALAKRFVRLDCRSMSIDRMKLFFRELPLNDQERAAAQNSIYEVNEISTTVSSDAKRSKKISQETMIAIMENLVSRDVIGKIEFPMMSSCVAEVNTFQNKDGSHWMVFSDGVYGFALRLDMKGKDKVRSIEVKTLN